VTGSAKTRREPILKRRSVMFVFVVGGAAVLPCLFSYCQTIYALASRKLEMVFHVTDAESGEPIPHASIELIAEGQEEEAPDQGIIHLVTDGESKASFVREGNSCEDVIRPFRKTTTLIDLTWASATISANGYSPVQGMWLHSAKYENKGYSSDGRCQQVEFNLSLHRCALHE